MQLNPINAGPQDNTKAIHPGDTTIDSDGNVDGGSLTLLCAGLITVDSDSQHVLSCKGPAGLICICIRPTNVQTLHYLV